MCILATGECNCCDITVCQSQQDRIDLSLVSLECYKVVYKLCGHMHASCTINVLMILLYDDTGGVYINFT